MKILRIVTLLMCLAGAAEAQDSLVFSQGYSSQRMPYDASITRISVKIPNMKRSAFADYCVVTMRTKEEPFYRPAIGRGGYVESLCFYIAHKKGAGDWEQSIDLSATPLFMPEGTEVACNSLGSLGTSIPGMSYFLKATSLFGNCTISIERYSNGPRYRVLRLPYWDQVFSKNQPLVPAHYTAWDERRPLKIASVMAYIANNHRGTQMTFCLLHLRRDTKAELKRHCMAEVGEQSPGLVPLDWTIKHDEMIGITCYYPPKDDVSTGDCVAGLVAEIPPDLKVGAENAFRDYGLVPRELVPEWCETAADTFKVERVDDPRLCLGAETCPRNEKIANCKNAFQYSTFEPAKCMATNSCFE